jgi:hypothetical protein
MSRICLLLMCACICVGTSDWVPCVCVRVCGLPRRNLRILFPLYCHREVCVCVLLCTDTVQSVGYELLSPTKY